MSLEQIIQQLLLTLSPYMLFVCLIGTTLGILWGAMPGLSTTMAMALLIGLSAGMSQSVAIMFMLGVYTGSVFGGAISAVLINIPGTPDAVPTMMEGHPLALKGEGGLALGTVLTLFVVPSAFVLLWKLRYSVFSATTPANPALENTAARSSSGMNK